MTERARAARGFTRLLLAPVLALLLTLALADPTAAAPPDDVQAFLAALPVQLEASMDGYDRDLFLTGSTTTATARTPATRCWRGSRRCGSTTTPTDAKSWGVNGGRRTTTW